MQITFALFVVTNVIDMDAIDLIIIGYLARFGSQIVGNLRMGRLQITLSFKTGDPFGMSFRNGPFTKLSYLFFTSYRKANKPGMTLKSSFMTFANGIFQRIVSRLKIFSSGTKGASGFEPRTRSGERRVWNAVES